MPADVSPQIIRKTYSALTGVDFGVGLPTPQALAELLTKGIVPVVLINPTFLSAKPDGVSQVALAKGNAKTGTAIIAGTGLLLYTVSANKTFYLTAMHVETGAAGSGPRGVVYDATSLTGSPILNFMFPSNNVNSVQTVGHTFPTPVAFKNGVFIDVSANDTVYWYIVGWEE